MNRPTFIAQDSEILFVSAEETTLRLDKFLVTRYPRYSRTYFQTLLEEGFVLLNGEPAKKRILPKEGDEIEVCFQLLPELSLEPEAIPLEILYEDEHFLAVNKPVGMVVHPGPGHRQGTFVNALLAHCQEIKNLQKESPLRPGIVHRLDKDTSGILIAAKTLEAHQKLIALFASRKMEKFYLAICLGRPKNGFVTAPIARNPTDRQQMAVHPSGKEAMTEVNVVAFNDRISLVLLKPKTGRTHQIRVHLKHLGTPVLGDEVYGSSRSNNILGTQRQLLHAYRLDFLHPITQAPIRLCAPIPSDMKPWIGELTGAGKELSTCNI